jgi:hypothetical protein
MTGPGPQSRRARRYRIAGYGAALIAGVGSIVFSLAFASLWVLFDLAIVGVPIALVGVTVGLLFLRAFVRALRASHPRATPGAALELRTEVVQRGGSVRVRVTTEEAAPFEAGLYCVESYDQLPETDPRRSGNPMNRVANQAVAYREWVPVPSPATDREIDFRVPEDAPYSYEGSALSFAWRVGVRRPGVEGALDQPVWIEP